MDTGDGEYVARREEMIREVVRASGALNPRVVAALRKVPRHEFVPDEYKPFAYENRPLPIGEGQTISQPLMVASMTEALDVQPESVVLEIGVGSGYQAAILAELSRQVYTLERRGELANRASRTLARLGYDNVEVIVADGSLGYPERAPYDRIMVTAGSPSVPDPLLGQLTGTGKIVIPVGDVRYQSLVLVEMTEDGPRRRELTGCVFVPLVGEYGWRPEEVDR